MVSEIPFYFQNFMYIVNTSLFFKTWHSLETLKYSNLRIYRDLSKIYRDLSKIFSCQEVCTVFHQNVIWLKKWRCWTFSKLKLTNFKKVHLQIFPSKIFFVFNWPAEESSFFEEHQVISVSRTQIMINPWVWYIVPIKNDKFKSTSDSDDRSEYHDWQVLPW